MDATNKKIAVVAACAAVLVGALWPLIGNTRKASTTRGDNDMQARSAAASTNEQAREATARSPEGRKAPLPKPQEQLIVNAVVPSDDKAAAELRQVLNERLERFGQGLRNEQMQAVLSVIYDLQLERDALDRDEDAMIQAAIEDPTKRPVPDTTWSKEVRDLADTQVSRILSQGQYNEYKRKISPYIPAIIRLRMVGAAQPNPQGA